MTQDEVETTEDGVSMTTLVITPQRVADRRHYDSVRRIELVGSLDEVEIKARIAKYAEEHDLLIGEMTVEWTLHVEAMGYPSQPRWWPCATTVTCEPI